MTESRSEVAVLIRGSERLRDMLLSVASGGTRAARGIVEFVSARYPERVLAVTFESCGGAKTFKDALIGAETVAPTAIRDSRPDILVLGFEADIEDLVVEWDSGAISTIETHMLEAIRLVKRDPGSHVFVMNCSTVVPEEAVSNYSETDSQPRSLVAHRLNLVAMSLSFEEGVSIIDVDRLIAEMGGSEHVRGFLDYSPEACEAISREFARIAEEYGFFDDRPLLPQVGRQSAS
jgi:hypothetical protein